MLFANCSITVIKPSTLLFNVGANKFSHLLMAVSYESKVRPARLERATFCFVEQRMGLL
jgi:hypothetical protein